MFSKFDFNDVKVNDFSARYQVKCWSIGSVQIVTVNLFWFGVGSGAVTLSHSVIATGLTWLSVFFGGIWGISNQLDVDWWKFIPSLKHSISLIVIVLITQSELDSWIWFRHECDNMDWINSMIQKNLVSVDLEYNLYVPGEQFQPWRLLKNMLQFVSVIRQPWTQNVSKLYLMSLLCLLFGLRSWPPQLQVWVVWFQIIHKT